jgi:hypothetical protein
MKSPFLQGSLGTAWLPLPVEDGRDSADSAVALGDLGGVSRRPPETRVASAVATALRQVSPGT